MAESGPQKASEPDPDASRHSETAEEENPAIAAFNSWGGEGSPPPPGFAHAPAAAQKPARRRTIGRTGSIARQAQAPPPVRARRPSRPPIDAITTRVPPAQAAPRPAADFLGPGGDVLRRALLPLALVGERVERLLPGPVLAPSSAPPASRCPDLRPNNNVTTRRRRSWHDHSSAEMITIERVHSPVLTARDSLTLHCGKTQHSSYTITPRR